MPTNVARVIQLPRDVADRASSTAWFVINGSLVRDLATVSYADFDDWRRATTSFTDLVLFSATAMNVTERGYSAERSSGVCDVERVIVC